MTTIQELTIAKKIADIVRSALLFDSVGNKRGFNACAEKLEVLFDTLHILGYTVVPVYNEDKIICSFMLNNHMFTI